MGEGGSVKAVEKAEGKKILAFTLECCGQTVSVSTKVMFPEMQDIYSPG